MLPVPNGLAPELAALTEPMAVGLHAVRRAEIRKRDVAIVIGCGPIGLAVICMLKARGVRTVIASDYSPGRRSLAVDCGADVVVDPAASSPYGAADDSGHLEAVPEALELALGTIEKLQRARVPWHHVWRTAERLGVRPKAPVVFECVGVTGVIDEIIAGAPLFSRVVVVGVCMGLDRIRPAMARSTRRSTCGSSSGTRRRSSRRRSTCSPRARSTRRRWSPGRWVCRASRAPSTRWATPRRTQRS